MSILGVDYGRSKIGLALSYGHLSQPLGVVRVKSNKDAIDKIRDVVEKEEIGKIVVGLSESKMGEEQKEFAQKLEEELGVNVETYDETLTTKDAQSLAIETGMSRKKRKEMEDAFAAALMLQSYLDQQP